MSDVVIEKTGKTIEEALSLALAELNAEQSDVDVEVIDEGNKGIFGLIGNKMAKVRVKKKVSLSKIAENFIKQILVKMNLVAKIDFKEDEESLYVNVVGNDLGILIGRRGETLEALQYLVSLVVNKRCSEVKKRVVLDIENYREKRRDTLTKLANKVAERVIKSKRPVTLEPMSPFERRIIHSTLQDNRYVETYSVGEEPERKVVVRLK